MMRPRTATGGVLPHVEQESIHLPVRGVRYRTAEEKSHALKQLVRPPFQSMQITPQQHQEAIRRQHSQQQQQQQRPAQTTGVRTNATHTRSTSTSHKKHPSASSDRRASLTSTSSTDATIHPASRPNAPSQMDARERAAQHVSKTGVQRAPKSHKLLTRPYANPYTATSTADMNESNAEVLVERHARPLVVRPKNREQESIVKFVPIGHVVQMKRGGGGVEQPTFKQERERDDPRYQQKLQQQQQDRRSISQERETNNRASDDDSRMPKRVQFTRQEQEDEERENMQHGSSNLQHQRVDPSNPQHAQQLSARTPTPPLITPRIEANQPPQPYSSQQQHQSRASSHSSQPSSTQSLQEISPNSLQQQRAKSPPSDSQHSHSQSSHSTATPARPSNSNHSQQQRHEEQKEQPQHEVSSPSPSRHTQPPQPTPQQNKAAMPVFNASYDVPPIAIPSSPRSSTQQQQDNLSHSHSRRADTNAAANSAISYDQDRKKIEKEYERHMKAYLSPTSTKYQGLTNSPRGGPMTSPIQRGEQRFTPNPNSASRRHNDEEEDDFSMSELNPSTRPAPLPSADPRAGVITHTKSLYPTTESERDPVRSLAANLRGKRMKYEVVHAGGGNDDGTALSPSSHPNSNADSIITDTSDLGESSTVYLRRLLVEAAEVREELAKAERAKWKSRWTERKQQAHTRALALDEARKMADRQANKAVGLMEPILASENIKLSTDAANQVVFGKPTSTANVNHVSRSAEPALTSYSSNTTSQHSPPSSSNPHHGGIPRRFIVGSTNATKVNAVRGVIDQIFANIHDASYLSASGRKLNSLPQQRRNEVIGVEVDSGVSSQPMSSTETKKGSLTRAKLALAADPTAEYGVGIEGGIEQIEGQYFESGWVSVIDRAGKIGIGTSSRYQVSEAIAQELMSGETELCHIVDRLSGDTNVRAKQGMMGVISNGLVQRTEAYQQGVIFAFAPFVSSAAFWDEKNGDDQHHR